MNKRGGIGFIVLLAVIVVAIIGLVMIYKSNKITGEFGVPQPSAYGGAIKGVASPGMRAFPGRATAMPDQSCYMCDCLQRGITAKDKETAARVCRDNCGGNIVSIVTGPC